MEEYTCACIDASLESVEKVIDHTSAILKLPKNYQNILILKYVKALSNSEIADRLHISEASVRKREERAKKRLRQILTQSNQ